MFATREEARQFALAGNARLTLVSRATGTRFTYRVRRPEEGKPWFVQVLTGPDNESSYTFFGTIFADGAFRHSPRASIRPEAPSAGAFTWFWQVLAKDGLFRPGARPPPLSVVGPLAHPPRAPVAGAVVAHYQNAWIDRATGATWYGPYYPTRQMADRQNAAIYGGQFRRLGLIIIKDTDR